MAFMRENASTPVAATGTQDAAANGYNATVVARLLGLLLRRVAARPAPVLVGLSGLQGSGKSTLARQLVELAQQRGIASVAMSLDDFYLTRRERQRLAREVHPLLRTRGVPGTHDLDLLDATVAALAHATPAAPARIPRFDKGRDTRCAPSRWRSMRTPPALIVLEGWCVGIPAQSAVALRRDCNDLERHDDAARRWRRWVNAQLEDRYARLWARLDALVVLQAPDFDVVRAWRDQQEHGLRQAGAPCAMSAPELARFLTHYERLSRHALRTLPALADIVVGLDHQRQVRRLTEHPSQRRSGS